MPGAVVGPLSAVVIVVVGAEEPVLGRYWTPDAGQFEVEPTENSQYKTDRCRLIRIPGLVGTNVPLCTLPVTS